MRRFFDPATIVLLMILAYMSITSGRFSSPVDWLVGVLLTLPAIIIAISFHEFAHAVTAYKLGDHTPKFQNRVTLNPVAHLDPFGLLCIIFIGFGWGKPVMVNPLNFRYRKRDEIIVSLAGVTMNLFLAVIFCAVFAFYLKSIGYYPFSGAAWAIAKTLENIAWINLVLMIFNLLPVPPLDGFNVVTELLNVKYTEMYYKIYNNGMWILMLLIIFNVVGVILRHTVSPIFNFLFYLFL